MAAGVVRQRITGMRILVIRLLVQRVPAVFKPLQHSGKLLAHVQQSLDPIGLRRCRTRPRGGGVGKSVLAVRRRTRDSTHRCVELHQQGLPPSVLQGLPRYGEPDAGGLRIRRPGAAARRAGAKPSSVFAACSRLAESMSNCETPQVRTMQPGWRLKRCAKVPVM